MATNYPQHHRVTWTTAGLALLTSALWGANPVAVSYSVDVVPPVAVAAIRFALATVFMICWCRYEGTSMQVRPGQWRPILIAGGLLFFQIGSFNIGVTLSNSSHAAMMINTAVPWIALIDHFIIRTDRLTVRKIAGLSLAGSGVVLVFLSRDPGNLSVVTDPVTRTGDCILLASAFILAIKVVYVKSALKVVESSKLILWHDVVGVVLFSIWSGAFERAAWKEPTTPAVVSLIFQGVCVAGFCFAVQAVLLRRHSASQIAVFGFATPLCGVALGVLMRGDPWTRLMWCAAAAVAGGIFLVASQHKPSDAKASAAES